MSLEMYSIPQFTGIDMSTDESLQKLSSPDARNMDTRNGMLSLGKGFIKHLATGNAVPGTERISKLHVFHVGNSTCYIVMAENNVYVCKGDTWTLAHTFSGSSLLFSYFCVEARIDTKDYLIIGNGSTQMIKYDGETVELFGSAEGLSDIAAGCASMYYNRLFAAGDRNHPSRLYWSQLPGSGRSIEDWGEVSASANVSGGHTEVGDTNSESITALIALSNQLLIFKSRSMYRLIGDRPSNFTIEKLCDLSSPVFTDAFVRVNDIGYYLTPDGLHMFNGINSYRTNDSDCIMPLLFDYSALRCKAARCNSTLYFAVGNHSSSCIIEYDALRCCYMVRDGFGGICDLVSDGDMLLMINSNRHIYRMNTGYTYDGEPINAYWRIPTTDLGNMGTEKQPRRLFMHLRRLIDTSGNVVVPFPAKSNATGSAGTIMATAYVDGNGICRFTDISSESDDCITEIPLHGRGRLFSLTLSNVDGSAFALSGGIQIEFMKSWRTE